jgi:hypothetical protein
MADVDHNNRAREYAPEIAAEDAPKLFLKGSKNTPKENPAPYEMLVMAKHAAIIIQG